ncbi:VWA domain-containing protein [Bacteroidota bacterium]
MKKCAFVFLLTSFFVFSGYSSGVIIKDASLGIYFKLESSQINVTINQQIATIVSTQYFKNNTGDTITPKYGFPLHEEASATNLRWYCNGSWKSAIFVPAPQDTTLPGGGTIDPNLVEYLGDTPMYFDFEESVGNDSILIVELTYVQLLPYKYNIVTFDYPNRYNLIQNNYVNSVILDLHLESERTINSIDMISHTATSINNYGDSANVYYEAFEIIPSVDFKIEYELSADELGLFGFSTFLEEGSNECDDFGNGFFNLIVEPDPGDSNNFIQKVFTLIIDESGSMGGNKIIQARAAAEFIVNNLNDGDMFNLVRFETSITSFKPDHVEFCEQYKNEALVFISNINASGSTNISGAFTEAIEDYANNDTTRANIIIFFTDGHPTAGITNMELLLQHIQDQQTYYNVNELEIHTFGIGMGVNQSLLSMIAQQNNGLCQFLLDNELQQMISEFYMMIRYPILINTQISFNPDIATELYPNPLTNLYLGHQLIIAGRYDVPDSVHVTFSGDAFGIPQSYEYDFVMTDTLNEDYMFTIKIWAKKKIEYLLVQYYSYPSTSQQAEEIKSEIIDISVCYNVTSPFTSFGINPPTGIEFDEPNLAEYEDLKTYSYPNPFTNEASIKFLVENDYRGYAIFTIYDVYGKAIKMITIKVDGNGEYKIAWDGNDQSGNSVPNGLYFYNISMGNNILKGSMLKSK